MGVGISTRTQGLDAFRREMAEERRAMMALADPGGVSVLNSDPKATFLQNRRGITVVDEDVLAEEADEAVAVLLASPKPLTPALVRSALKLAAFRAVRRMLDFVGSLARPLWKGGPARPRHRVGYADVTTELASSYAYAAPGERPTPYPYSGRPAVRRAPRTSGGRRGRRTR